MRTRIIAFSAIAAAAAFIGACGGGIGTGDSNEVAAKVNGKAIKMEEVDRGLKQQAGGEEAKFSPLELASARLQVLQSLIEQEVMFQKAEKMGTVPTEDEVIAEVNKQKTQSGRSADQIEKEMKEAGLTEATFREGIKKAMAIQKMIEKVTGVIEPPKDAEIDAFYAGNKEAFVKKKGVKLAAIVIDPSNSGEGDQTVDQQSAVLRANEVLMKLKANQDFAALAREYSEDQSKFQSGDLGYLSEDDLRQEFDDQTAGSLMSPQLNVGGIITARGKGKLFILKLQERSDKDESLTLESPGVRQQVTDSLISARKQLLAASFQAVAMNEAKIENFLAKKVVDNPNELSGARKAQPADANTAKPADSNANAAPANAANTANTANSANAAAPKADDKKPAEKPADKKEGDKPANAPANK
ncbi:MAG: SurA N-terminal domain-containing protein [Acidobacteria bacterium]|nr:SurA N-terminal domain-containing protein [Acidobacteriota bacterium]MCW5950440.1 SurA N-terminal domain-containing protein [Pyrinomonadaceae bacterium]